MFFALEEGADIGCGVFLTKDHLAPFMEEEQIVGREGSFGLVLGLAPTFLFGFLGARDRWFGTNGCRSSGRRLGILFLYHGYTIVGPIRIIFFFFVLAEIGHD